MHASRSGDGTELVVGKDGVLSGCQITGAGNITINGKFFERESPGIVGAHQLVVSDGGRWSAPSSSRPS